MRLLLFIMFQCFWPVAYSQLVTGKIIDADSKNPIEYVNIGVVGKNNGTVCDNNGWFSLELPEKFDNDTLRISVTGFNPVSYKVEDFKRIYQESIGGLVIELSKKVLVLPEVFATPKEFVEKTVGTKGKLLSIDFVSRKDTSLGGEIGTVIKVNKAGGALIQNLNVIIKSNTYDDSVLFRINIYSMNGELPGENVLTEPVYFYTKVKDGIVTVNLEKYHVYVDSDFFASLEWIWDIGEKTIGFGAGLKGRSFMRATSQGEWDKVPMGLGISIFATIVYVK